MKNIISNYNLTKNYLENSSSIRFLLVGPHNAGKSKILNKIIGYNSKLLETDVDECTKICVIIKYAPKSETPKLFEADFRTNRVNYNYYFQYDEDKKLAEGEEEIKKKIKELNHENSNKTNELKFYFLKTPIEIFDLIIEENIDSKEKEKIGKIIEKIELLDFPGLDTKFNEAKKKSTIFIKNSRWIYLC